MKNIIYTLCTTPQSFKEKRLVYQEAKSKQPPPSAEKKAGEEEALPPLVDLEGNEIKEVNPEEMDRRVKEAKSAARKEVESAIGKIKLSWWEKVTRD